MTSVEFHFDFGSSYTNNQPVKALVFDRLPNTIFLVLGAAVLWFVSGVTIGIGWGAEPFTYEAAMDDIRKVEGSGACLRLK